MTDYFAYRAAHAAGVHDDQTFLKALATFWDDYETTDRSSPSETALELRRYRQGFMAALMMDLELLRITRGRAGFREFLQAVFRLGRGVDGLTSKELEAALIEVGGRESRDLYRRWMEAAGIDPTRALAQVGLERDRAGGGATIVPRKGGRPNERARRVRFLAG